MTKRKLKPFVIPTIYVLSIIAFVTSIYFIQRIVSTKTFVTEEPKLEYVNKEILNTNQYLIWLYLLLMENLSALQYLNLHM